MITGLKSSGQPNRISGILEKKKVNLAPKVSVPCKSQQILSQIQVYAEFAHLLCSQWEVFCDYDSLISIPLQPLLLIKICLMWQNAQRSAVISVFSLGFVSSHFFPRSVNSAWNTCGRDGNQVHCVYQRQLNTFLCFSVWNWKVDMGWVISMMGLI